MGNSKQFVSFKENIHLAASSHTSQEHALENCPLPALRAFLTGAYRQAEEGYFSCEAEEDAYRTGLDAVAALVSETIAALEEKALRAFMPDEIEV